MKNWISTVLTLLTISSIYSQTFIQSADNANFRLKKYSELKGDIYLFPENFKSDIYDNKGLFKSNIEVNYHKEMGEFVATYKGNDILLNSAEYPKFIVFDNEDEIDRVFINRVDPKHPLGYFEVLFEGENFKLLKKYEAKIIEGGSINYGRGSDTGYVKSKEKYYYLQNGELDKIKLKDKDILKPLKNRKEAKRYAKKNNIDFKDEKEVVSLLEKFAK